MDNKIIGRFEPIGDDKGPKRSAFNVLTKEDAECLGTNCKRGYTGVDADGLKYSVIHEYWRWVPASPSALPFNRDAEANEPAFGTFKQAGHLALSTGGLTVRDSFAQAALQGAQANPETRKEQVYKAAADQVELHTSMARTAYALADAMLAERAK